MVNNKNSFTYKKYRRNIKGFFIKNIIFIVLFFILLYIVLKIFSILLNPRIFTSIFLISLFIFILFDRLLNKKLTNLLKKNYLTWGKGAGAELVVKRSLDSLGVEFKIIDDIQSGKGNIDIVCVGPTGVFVVEVKAHSGFVSWNNELLLNGRHPEKDFIKQVHGEIHYVKDLLKKMLGKDYDVQGILEFTNAKRDNQTIRGQRKGIWIGVRGFAKWVVLRKGKEQLPSEEIKKIYNILNKKNF